MKLFLTPEFLCDLREANDPRFVRRVLSHVLDERGEFRRGQNDHRYRDIEDAWIRYVSKGKTGYRMIYIQRGENVYLYRAGVHSIEDNLSPPRRLHEAVRMERVEPRSNVVSDWQAQWFDVGELLKTTQETMLRKVMHALTFVGHTEIILVSPFVSDETLASNAPLGRFLDKMIEEGTTVVLVTRPPDVSRIDYFRRLEERQLNVHFYQGLHAKLYLFDVRPETLSQFTKDMKPTAILGSANLTEMGLALTSEEANEELCYRLPATKFDEARNYAYWLVKHSDDVNRYRERATRRF